MTDKSVPMTARELTTFKGYTFPKGAWRNALFRQFERIDAEGENAPEPKPIIDRIAYRFLKLCLTAGHDGIAFFKELGDRLDGRPAQEVSLVGDPERPLFISNAEELRAKLRGVVTETADDSGHTIQ